MRKPSKIALLVHGINVTNPGNGVGKLQTYFEATGIPTVIVDYGFRGVIGAKFGNKSVARMIARLADVIQSNNGKRVIAVGHSNGCAILHQASTEFSARLEYLVYINPALSSNAAPGPNVKHCDVYHSPGDTPVKVGARLRKWLPGIAPEWGLMGARGYTGGDPRVKNYNKENDFPVVSKEHSDFFDWDKVAFFGPTVVAKIVDTYLPNDRSRPHMEQLV